MKQPCTKTLITEPGQNASLEDTLIVTRPFIPYFCQNSRHFSTISACHAPSRMAILPADVIRK